MSLQVSVDVRSSGSGLERSGHVWTGPAFLNYSLSYWYHDGNLVLSGWGQHDSDTLLQAGIPGEAHLDAELQMQGEPLGCRARVPHAWARPQSQGFTQADCAGPAGPQLGVQ